MPTGNSAQKAIQTVEDFLQSVGAYEKQAAEAHTEPCSIGGATSHPVKNVDDHTRPATEGARSAENTKDVKEEIGKPAVDALPNNKAAGFAKGAEGSGGSAAQDQLQIGTNKQPTGEDPKNETAGVKGGKEDSKTTHPARTDNDALAGGKYAADTPLDKLAADMQELGNQLCAQLAVLGHDQQVSTKTAAQAQSQPQTNKQAAIDDSWLASQVGWEMAGLITGKFDKQAADSLVFNTLRNVVKLANDRADRLIRFYDNHFAALQQAQKQGAEMPPGDDPAAGGAGGAPPGGGEAMMAALGGGSPADGATGGAPGGAPPGGAPPGGGGGGEAEAMQMAQLLQQLHITPEQLEQMLMQMEGGGGGEGGAGGDPMAGGAPPGGDAGPPAGGAMPPEVKAAADRAAAKIAAADMHNYIREIVQRSRQRRAA